MSTLTDVAVSCENGALCNSTVASTCTIEFLTELGDVPLVSASVSNIDSIAVSEFQVSEEAIGGGSGVRHKKGREGEESESE